MEQACLPEGGGKLVKHSAFGPSVGDMQRSLDFDVCLDHPQSSTTPMTHESDLMTQRSIDTHQSISQHTTSGGVPFSTRSRARPRTRSPCRPGSASRFSPTWASGCTSSRSRAQGVSMGDPLGPLHGDMGEGGDGNGAEDGDRPLHIRVPSFI